MKEINFYILDVETTGLTTKLHEITEFSIIRCKDKVSLNKQVRCDHPESASIDALRITNKTLDDLNQGISKQEACTLIKNFLEQDNLDSSYRCIVGHNVSFDRKFLQSMFTECMMELEVDLWLDTLKITKNFIKTAGLKSQKAKLKDACELFKTKIYPGEHNSKSDSRNTFYLFEELKKQNSITKYIELKKNESYDFNESDLGID